MSLNQVFLPRTEKLVDAVADWLMTNVETDASGARSLEHLLVVVPTRQSARRLRWRLAQRAGALVPPRIVQPLRLVNSCLPPPSDGMGVASETEELAIWTKLLSEVEWNDAFKLVIPSCKKSMDKSQALAVARQFMEVRATLAQNGLRMGDVASQPKAQALWERDGIGTEEERWAQLGRIEGAYYELLHSIHLCDMVERTAAFFADGGPSAEALAKVPFLSGVKAVVLPALADPTPVALKLFSALDRAGTPLHVLFHADEADVAAGKFDEYGRPSAATWGKVDLQLEPGLDDEDVFLFPNAKAEAAAAAQVFNRGASLCMADDTSFPLLESAFWQRPNPLFLHNPEKSPLAPTSLGRLVADLAEMSSGNKEWKLFSAFMRQDDVLNWLKCRNPDVTADDGEAVFYSRREVLEGLDLYQNDLIPLKRPTAAELEAWAERSGASRDVVSRKAIAATVAKLEQALAKNAGELLPKRLALLLQEVYATRKLAGHSSQTASFASAATAVMGVLEEVGSEIVRSVLGDDGVRLLLLEKLSEVNYQVDADTSDVIETEGWLELPWSSSDNILATGFNEGKVPDSIVGHPFLPDSLRIALGLQSNAQRLARDAFLLQEVLACRKGQGGRVTIFLPQADSRGEVLKPSRLLFLCSAAQLPHRVKRLLKTPAAAGSAEARSLPTGWKLRFKQPIKKPDHLSPSAIDTYLRCPFTYYLQRVQKMDPVDDEKRELGYDDFGTFMHEILQAFANGPAKNETDEQKICAAVLAEYDRQKRALFDGRPSAIVAMQMESVKSRLVSFARLQAQQRAAGWEIYAAEQVCESVIPEVSDKIPIRGYIDRIDINRETGAVCLVDYKTWNVDRKIKEKIYRQDTIAGDEFPSRGFSPCTVPAPTDRDPNRMVDVFWATVQLPLYKRLAELTVCPRLSEEFGRPFTVVDMRYCVLGNTPDMCAWYNGSLQANPAIPDGELDRGGILFEHSDAALATARKAVEGILAGDFSFCSALSARSPYWDFARLFLNPGNALGEVEMGDVSAEEE